MKLLCNTQAPDSDTDVLMFSPLCTCIFFFSFSDAYQAPTTRLMTKQAKPAAFHAATEQSLPPTEPPSAIPAPPDGAAHLVAPVAHQQSPSSRAPCRSLPFNSDPSRRSISSSFTLDRTQSHGTLIPPRCHHGLTSAMSLELLQEARR